MNSWTKSERMSIGIIVRDNGEGGGIGDVDSHVEFAGTAKALPNFTHFNDSYF
jgi:hypothetical protein